tara:strand:+ start:8558 stop:9550 length:993 start_codon:yes stop_codon:yes gene_type:complete
LKLSYPTIIVTSGEPAGIGPDICGKLGSYELPARLIVLGDPDVIGLRIKDLGMQISLKVIDSISKAKKHNEGSLQILPIQTKLSVDAGKPNPQNAHYVLQQLETATRLCSNNSTTALVTAPVQKSTIVDAGIPFTGHTEWLAKQTYSSRPVMMLVSDSLKVALATTHLPLEKVSAAITEELLEEIITILDHDLKSQFLIKSPRIMVLGLNPHAGENGKLGSQETIIMKPILKSLCERGINLFGPVPADTAFRNDYLKQSDVVLAMYHDQGLPVIKALSFGNTVNVTLGLPIIRTSVDHGTALDLAGTGYAKENSLLKAIELAINLVNRCH